MERETTGIVTAAAKQWWLKVNTKAFRTHPADGALFPYIITVRYTVENREYTKRKWISALSVPPAVGSTVTVRYPEKEPQKATIVL